MNPKLGQRWASSATKQKNHIGQRTVWNTSINQLQLLLIFKGGIYWWENTSSQQKIIITLIRSVHRNQIYVHAGKQKARSAELEALAVVFEESNTESKPKLPRCKNIDGISTLNVRTLNAINQQHEFTKSTAKHNAYIIYVQEFIFNLRELDLKWPDTDYKRTFVLASARVLDSLNSFEKTQSRIMCATCNNKLRLVIISSYFPTFANDETSIITFYNGLSSLAQHIP